MSYQRWKRWLLSLPPALRWFVFLVLLRPLIDGLYFLKNINPFYSPLVLIGGLTPVLVVASVLAPSVRRRLRSPVDSFFALWGGMLCLNALAILIASREVAAFEAAAYLIGPVFVFILVRHLIRDAEDMLGLLTTFLWSLIVPFGLILYESIVGPIKTQLSRGLIRNEGIFADVASYGLYINLGLLAAAYLVLETHGDLTGRRRILRFGTVFVVGMLGLLNIYHATSFGVFIALSTLFLLAGPRLNGLAVAAVLLVSAVLVGITQMRRFEDVRALYAVDIDVLEGSRDLSSAFHGRAGRWERLLTDWQEMPLFARAVGVTFDTDLEGYTYRMMVLKGTHSDYLRILFASGIIGLVGFLSFCAWIAVRSLALNRADRFLVLGALLIVLLYSVTLTPSLYTPVQYICFAVFAFAGLRHTRPQLQGAHAASRRLPDWRYLAPGRARP